MGGESYRRWVAINHPRMPSILFSPAAAAATAAPAAPAARRDEAISCPGMMALQGLVRAAARPGSGGTCASTVLLAFLHIVQVGEHLNRNESRAAQPVSDHPKSTKHLRNVHG